MQQWYSVEQVADLLGLHVKTVRRYVRDGRLRAIRVGKQYRISREDLAEFTGERPEPVSRSARVEVSSVAQIDGVGPESMNRLTTVITSSLRREAGDAPVRVETVHDEEHARLKVIIVGDAARTAEVLQLIDAIAGPDVNTTYTSAAGADG